MGAGNEIFGLANIEIHVKFPIIIILNSENKKIINTKIIIVYSATFSDIMIKVS